MKLILLLILAYLLDSVPSGVWIGKLFFREDIRQYGNGNAGTINTFRVLGKTAGIVVFPMDILKDILATCLPMISHLSRINPLRFGVCAILGHIFPIFAGFKGGKVVATSVGMLLGLNPVSSVYSCTISIVSLLCTGVVSLSSVISAALITLSVIVLPYVVPVILTKPNWLLTIIALLVSSFIFYRHKDGIKHIRNYTESRILLGLNSSKKKS